MASDMKIAEQKREVAEEAHRLLRVVPLSTNRLIRTMDSVLDSAEENPIDRQQLLETLADRTSEVELHLNALIALAAEVRSLHEQEVSLKHSS